MWCTLNGTGSLSVNGCWDIEEEKVGGREGWRVRGRERWRMQDCVTYYCCFFTNHSYIWPSVSHNDIIMTS